MTLALALAVASLAATAVQASAAPRPIVYAVVIDGLDGDVVDAGRAPFIASLLRGNGARSTYYQESRSVMVAETNPNHAAMMTGAYSDTSGIAGNGFALYSPLRNDAGCDAVGAFDESKTPVRSKGESADCVLAQTVFEAIKRQGNPDRLITAAVFGKIKLGRIFAGRRFESARRDVDYLWAPCPSGSVPATERDYCANVPIDPIPTVMDRTLDDTLVMNAVLATIRNGVEAGGQRRRPDFTFVNLPQVDNAGHFTGVNTPNPGGPPIETAFGELRYQQAVALADGEIERLVTELRRRGEWDRTVLVLLSDHSHDSGPLRIVLTEELKAAGIPERDFVVTQGGSTDAVYLANRTAPNRHQLLARMRAAILGLGGVDEALYREPNPADGGTRHTVSAVHPGWHAAGPRNGDILVTAKPGVAFSDPSLTSNPVIGNHGAPHTSDNFFAVVGGGDFVRQRSVDGIRGARFDDTLDNPGQSENVDVAPTLMGLLGLAAPSGNAGRWLGDAFDLAKLPGAGKPAKAPKLKLKRLSRGGCRGPRYRLTWSPAGVYDLGVAATGGEAKPNKRSLRKRSRLQSAVFRAAPGRRYAFKLHARAASGKASKAARASIGPVATPRGC